MYLVETQTSLLSRNFGLHATSISERGYSICMNTIVVKMGFLKVPIIA